MESLWKNCSYGDVTLETYQSALQTYNIPNLRELVLNGNNIGREGCITISNLLKKESTVLTEVFLIDTGVNDEGVEIIANSLKHNTTLEKLNLTRNGITEKGCKAFLKLLVHVSSTIENTYKSNHTLTECILTRDNNKMQSLINQ